MKGGKEALEVSQYPIFIRPPSTVAVTYDLRSSRKYWDGSSDWTSGRRR
jgi:hypothetical protein